MVEKSVEFEIVRIKKTETENEFEKILNDFKDVSSIYEKLMSGNFGVQAKSEIENIQRNIIKEVVNRTEEVKSLIKNFYKLS